ncbi:hypothetical protein QTI33_29665 [Variovorax sp. J22P271]|uniref:hypothetical protein n=1 Tax=Variovorax davisae TaxID=3053515 RepID=UPI0025752677|nr:hypothetical protein [Variovorax sp. J22P271]MDM0036336.1 hypothetical protein [Variovorax sp. J22P271]
MSLFASPRFLSRVMAADAVSCAATGALQLIFGTALARWTGLPPPLLLATGVFLLAYAAAAAWMARRALPPRRLIGWVVAGNFAWALACIGLLAVTGSSIAAPGWAWVLAQAVVVVVFAELQWMGLRNARAPGPRALAA